MGQYPDGFRGPLLIHDPNSPYLDDYEDDQILTISDWQATLLIPIMFYKIPQLKY